jgi:hypothetical protein
LSKKNERIVEERIVERSTCFGLHPSNKSILLKLWNEKEGLAFSKAEQSTSWLSAQHQLIKYILVSDFKNNIS